MDLSNGSDGALVWPGCSALPDSGQSSPTHQQAKSDPLTSIQPTNKQSPSHQQPSKAAQQPTNPPTSNPQAKSDPPTQQQANNKQTLTLQLDFHRLYTTVYIQYAFPIISLIIFGNYIWLFCFRPVSRVPTTDKKTSLSGF